MSKVAAAHVIDAGDMSQADLYSTPTNVGGMARASYQYKWSSSDAVGVVSVEVSNGYDKDRGTGTWSTWTPATSVTNPNSDNGHVTIDLGYLCFGWARLRYHRTSGSGTLDAWFDGRGAA